MKLGRFVPQKHKTDRPLGWKDSEKRNGRHRAPEGLRDSVVDFLGKLRSYDDVYDEDGNLKSAPTTRCTLTEIIAG